MNNIKLCLKLWSSNAVLLGNAVRLVEDGVFQCVELMVVPDTDISPFLRAKIPFILHVTSENWGFNISDGSKRSFNLSILENCFEWAEKLSAPYLVLHPGFGDIGAAKDFLNGINDRRILIENMPAIGDHNEAMVGYDHVQIKELIGNRFGFCLDFGHAVKAATSLKKGSAKMLGDFLEISPVNFHICDGITKNEKDEHLSFGAGDFDLNFFASCVKKSRAKYITLETPRTDGRSLRDDLANAAILRSLLDD